MRGFTRSVLMTALGLVIIGGAAAFGAEPPASPPGLATKAPHLSAAALQRLLDLMVEKGLLTAEERAEMERQAAIEAEAAKVAPPPVAVAPAPEKPKYPTLKTRVRLQPRFSVVQEDSNQPFFGERDDQIGNDGFSVRRARLDFMGQLNPDVGYCLQYQSDVGTEDANLHVAQVEWKGWEPLNLVAGQLQTPFGYEIVISDGCLLLIDRSAVSDFLPPDKDIGVRLDGKKPLLGKLNYQLFLGNGSMKYKGNPSNDGYLWIARATTKPSPYLTIGADYSTNSDTDASPYQSRFLKKNGDPYGLLASYTSANVDETAWSADFQYCRNPVTVWGEYIRARFSPGTGPAIAADGWYLDAGYFLPYQGRRDKLQLVAGYQQFDPNTSVTDRVDMHATTLGLNYYITGYEHMVRLNYVWTDEKVSPVDNNKLILQYQLWF
jgi:phosphate-selective porin